MLEFNFGKSVAEGVLADVCKSDHGAEKVLGNPVISGGEMAEKKVKSIVFTTEKGILLTQWRILREALNTHGF